MQVTLTFKEAIQLIQYLETQSEGSEDPLDQLMEKLENLLERAGVDLEEESNEALEQQALDSIVQQLEDQESLPLEDGRIEFEIDVEEERSLLAMI